MRNHQWRSLVALAAIAAMATSRAAAQDKPAAAKGPRVLFVIDVETEEALAGAQVHDMITGNSMKTSAAGAVGLLMPAFVKKTGAMIEVRMTGYQTSARTFVDPTDTMPIVFALLKENSTLTHPAVRLRKDSTFFSILAVNESGEPMADATVAIVKGLATALASKVTDSTGQRQLAVADVASDVQITVQKVGYAPYKQFYNLRVADTVEAQIAMFPLANQLNAVNVTAKRKVMHLDEDEILTSKRPLADALDIVTKLRPAMFGERLRGVPGCGVADKIYINGRRIYYPPQEVDLNRIPRRASRASSRGLATLGNASVKLVAPKAQGAVADGSDTVKAILATIKPEHVAEMTYIDCFDTSIPGVRRNNAIYVVLKLGIEYDERRGSSFSRDTTGRQ